MTAPRRGAGEHVAEAVFACVLFAYAGLSGLVFVVGLVCAWCLSPAVGGACLVDRGLGAGFRGFASVGPGAVAGCSRQQGVWRESGWLW